jgi:ketosteroid isomerase-like protein
VSATGSVQIVLGAFAAVESRDDQRLQDVCDPQVLFHWPPCLPYGGQATGLEAIRADRSWDGAWRPLQPTPAERNMDPRVVAATDTEVVVLWHQRGRSPSGATFDGEVLGLYQVRDGALARAQMFYYDPVAAHRFLDTHHPARAANRG